MDYQTLTLFSVEEFTDIAHGMTARSTKSKRTIVIPNDENWEVTNQQTTERRSPRKVTIALQKPETITN